MKSEPESYSIADLKKEKRTGWSGVRNYQARNFMQSMAVGDLVIFYHSNAAPPGAAGVAKVVKTAYPDPTAFDAKDHHFDPKSNPEKPTWHQVDVAHVATFKEFVPLDALKEDKKLSGLLLTSGKAMQLSVQPLSKPHFDRIVALGKS
ncbi:MAG: EVE domain-containing protein [Candidatus Thermoplasmatota archaeon]